MNDLLLFAHCIARVALLTGLGPGILFVYAAEKLVRTFGGPAPNQGEGGQSGLLHALQAVYLGLEHALPDVRHARHEWRIARVFQPAASRTEKENSRQAQEGSGVGTHAIGAQFGASQFRKKSSGGGQLAPIVEFNSSGLSSRATSPPRKVQRRRA